MTKEEIFKKVNAIKTLKEDLNESLSVLVPQMKKIAPNVSVEGEVAVEPNVFFDTSEGEILIGEGTKIKANAVLRGPLIVGKNSVINVGAEISCSRIGESCKVGGEVSHSIISDFSNKQHAGSLGHSFVGSWVNIGGGSSVSNLKNTYGSISVAGTDTGEVFMGAIIGDHVKIAINTSIYCGKVIGESSHIYGTVVEDVPAFVSYLRAGRMYELPYEVAEKVAERMMARRGKEFTAGEKADFKKLFKDTSKDRKKAKAKKGKLNFK